MLDFIKPCLFFNNKGFLDGIQGMCSGEVRRLIVPAHLHTCKYNWRRLYLLCISCIYSIIL
jgi:hypothetical protein